MPPLMPRMRPEMLAYARAVDREQCQLSCTKAAQVIRGMHGRSNSPAEGKRKAAISLSVSKEGKLAKIRSGFEKDLQHSRARPSLEFKAGITNLGNGTRIGFYPRAFAERETNFLKKLQDEVAWEQQEIQVMGRKAMQPRLVAYMADDTSLSYSYSHTKQRVLPWSPAAREIKAKIEEVSGCNFNSCLLNLYRDGKDSLSWHSDNEKPYGPHPTIGSVSFGCARDFLLRNNADRGLKYTAKLGGKGDVLIMSGSCQRDWQHSVPKRSNALGPRINLTFRTIVKPDA